jgi:hypothetical protein
VSEHHPDLDRGAIDRLRERLGGSPATPATAATTRLRAGAGQLARRGLSPIVRRAGDLAAERATVDVGALRRDLEALREASNARIAALEADVALLRAELAARQT